jgi:hypothetical protein
MLSASDSGPTPRRAKSDFLRQPKSDFYQSVNTGLRNELGWNIGRRQLPKVLMRRASCGLFATANGQLDGLKDTVKKLQQVAASKRQEARKIASAPPEMSA